MRVYTLLCALLSALMCCVFARPAHAELPTPAAMDLYCKVLPGKATSSYYHQPDGQLASPQVLGLTPGEYVTRQDAHVYVLPSKAYLIRFPEAVTLVEATRGPDYMAYWTQEHPMAMGGCSLQQLSEALHRNGQALWYSLPETPESWLAIREAPGEEVRIPDNKLDTGYIEVYARYPKQDVLEEFCKSMRPMRSYRAPDMPGPGEYALTPGGRLRVFEKGRYFVFLKPSANRMYGTAVRDIFFPAQGPDEGESMHVIGGCSAAQLFNVLQKNGLGVAAGVER